MRLTKLCAIIFLLVAIIGVVLLTRAALAANEYIEIKVEPLNITFSSLVEYNTPFERVYKIVLTPGVYILYIDDKPNCTLLVNSTSLLIIKDGSIIPHKFTVLQLSPSTAVVFETAPTLNTTAIALIICSFIAIIIFVYMSVKRGVLG